MDEKAILVVDDSRQTAEFIAGSVLPSLGYSAICAYGGKKALQILRERHQEILLMLVDYQMPDLNGVELLKAANKEGINAPTIMVTAYGSEEVTKDAFTLGVHDVLRKPLDVDQLNVAISRVLAGSRLRAEKAELTNRLQDQVSWMTALLEVGRSVTSSLDINIVLQRILEAGVSLTQADQGFIALREAYTDRLYLRAVKNFRATGVDKMRLPVTDPLFRKAIQTGSPVRIAHSGNNTKLKVSTGLLVNSLIHVPILYQGRPLGILSMNNHSQRRDFSEKDENILISLADYAGIAIGNANSYEKAKLEIEERKRIEAALRESEERFSLAVHGSNDGVWDWNLKKNQIFYSPRWKQILGYDDHEIGNSPDEWFGRIHVDDLDHTLRDISTHIHKKTSHYINEHRLRHKDGTYRWVLCRGIAVWNDQIEAVRLAGSMSDITDRKEAEERLLHDAFHDSLTQLPNRALFMDRLNQALVRSIRKEGYKFAVLFLDLDNLKDINDSIGHMVGDQLLVKVAETLQKGLRSIDTLARFGGDEYIILLDDITDINGVVRVTDWIKEELNKPILVGGHEVLTSASIGIVLSQPDYSSAEEIIRNADIAMYAAKDRGKARAEIFDPTMRQKFLDRLGIETDLKKALQKQELVVYYQPIVNFETGIVFGFEALVRWQHPEKGLVRPSEFIQIAEETGMVADIDRWVLRESCAQVSRWNQSLKLQQDLSISVNISGKHITAPDLQYYLKRVLDSSKLSAENLKLEITELSLVEKHESTSRALSNMQNMGVQIYIDDFGIGYSSLAYLTHFPINALKIDQIFVSRILEENSQRDIVQAIITLTKSLKVNVIAEGVETKDQLKELIRLGCEWGQGNFFSPPLTASEMEETFTRLSDGNGKLIIKL
jgi:diguanylate cyclase (GGDEF)-like protein/PAS domain S-box-containing protein